MKLDTSVEIPFSRQRVFETYRDRLPELVPYLPNIRGIEVTSREDAGPAVVKLVNHWRGGGEIPAIARSVLSEKLLEWDDFATWDAGAYQCDWRQTVPAFKDAFRSQGLNQFSEMGPDRTRLTISGSIDVDASRIPGVPRLFKGAVGAAVEAFLVAAIKPNLLSVSKGVEQYLREHPPK
jgi:hypothetical protein